VALAFIRPEDVNGLSERGRFRGHPFNTSIQIDGGGEGEYELFFDTRVA
jgi:hypothetical protein